MRGRKKAKDSTPTHNIVVAGGGGSGKSAFTQMYIFENFIEEYDPTTADQYFKNIDYNGTKTILDILDTAGQEDVLRNHLNKIGDGYLIVYSVIERTTFEAAQRFHEHILSVIGKDEHPTVLVGSKIDLEGREVTREDGLELAKKWNCPFFEASAKKKINVDESFLELVRLIIKHKIENPQTTSANQKKSCLIA